MPTTSSFGTTPFLAVSIDSAIFTQRVDLFEAFSAGSVDSASMAPSVPIQRGFLAASVDSASFAAHTFTIGQFFAGSVDSASLSGIVSVHGSFFAGSIDSAVYTATTPGDRFGSFFAGSVDSASVGPLVPIGGSFLATSIDSATIRATIGTDSFFAGSVDSATFGGIASTRGAFLAGSVDSAYFAGGVSGTHYHIYENDGNGGPINYNLGIATATGLTWTSAALAYPGNYLFGVRPFDASTGFEDKNVDAYIKLVLDAAGNDITGRPNAPVNVAARPLANGGARVEWSYFTGGQGGAPTSFALWLTAGSVVNYLVPPIGTPAYIPGRFQYKFDIVPTTLADGVMYTVGIRATNGIAAEPNMTATATVTGDSTPPMNVDGLTATVTG